MAKNHSVKYTHHVTLVGKRIIHHKDERPMHDKTNDASNNSNDEGDSKKTNITETSTSGQSTANKPESKNYFRHDSKFMTICRFDKTSYQILQLTRTAKPSRVPKAATDGESLYQNL